MILDAEEDSVLAGQSGRLLQGRNTQGLCLFLGLVVGSAREHPDGEG